MNQLRLLFLGNNELILLNPGTSWDDMEVGKAANLEPRKGAFGKVGLASTGWIHNELLASSQDPAGRPQQGELQPITRRVTQPNLAHPDSMKRWSTLAFLKM